MHYQQDGIKLSRVEYMSLPVPGELVGLSTDQITKVGWREAPWSENDQVVISAAAWFLEVGKSRIVLDPVQAVDVLLRSDAEAEQHHQTAIAEKFAESGFEPSTIDFVLMSHIEGVGMVAKREEGKWLPYFPNAEVLISDVQLKAFEEMEKDTADPTHQCWLSLIEQGVVTTFADGEEVFPDVVAEVSGFHCAGHTVFHFNGANLSFIGHLAVSPLHISTGPCADLNEMPDESFAELHRVIADGRQLIGPLWPAPGMGRWQNEAFA
jgi:hypothetical protein